MWFDWFGLVWFGLVLWHINRCWLFYAKSIFIQINSSISNHSVYHNYSFCLHTVKCKYILISNNSVYHKIIFFCLHTVKCKTILFQKISLGWLNFKLKKITIWPIDRTLSGASTPGQNGPGSDSNKGVLDIPLSSSIIVVSRLDCLVSYPEHSRQKC